MEIDLFEAGLLEWPEVWRPVKGYEGLYEVSNKGRVRRLTTKCGKLFENPRVLKNKYDWEGYPQVVLARSKNDHRTFHIHRLVAKTFVQNPHNLPEVNHINENNKDNRAENLEWCTHIYNCNYGTRNQRVAKKQSIPVNQYTMNGEFVRTWKSSMEAGRNGFRQGNIINCCKGRQKSCNGYKWSYAI